MSEVLKPLELYIEREQKYISYLFQNTSDCLNVESKWFLNKELKIIFESIKKLYNKNINIELDIVYDKIKQKINYFKFEQLKLIKDSYIDFSNIKEVKKGLKEQYLKQILAKSISENILEIAADSKDIKEEDLKRLYKQLGDVLDDLDQNKILLKTYSDLKDKYKERIRERQEGINKRCIGFPEISKKLTYAGEPGDCMSFVMLKGNGKTIFGLTAAMNLILSGVCVVYIGLDMGEITMMDRTISSTFGFENKDLTNGELSRDDFARLRKSLNELEEYKNYIHISNEESNETLTLNKLDSICYDIKNKFKKLNVLPKDEYVVLIFDTLDMIEDFSESESAYNIKKCVNKRHKILRKHKMFAIDLLQANENKIRSRNFSNPDTFNNFRIGMEDIEGGASYASRSRVVLSGNRPLHMKKTFFPDHEDRELWDTEEDIFYISIVKQNDGPLAYFKYGLDTKTLKIYPKID